MKSIDEVLTVLSKAIAEYDVITQLTYTRRLIQAVRVMEAALEFSCGDRCARGINDCSSRDALDKVTKILGGSNGQD